MSLTPELEVLREVTRRLDASGFSYMVTGSMALGYYVEPRTTRDADVVVELAEADSAQFAAVFGPEFDADADRIRRAIVAHRMFNLIHVKEVVKIDFIVRKSDPFRTEEFRRRRRVVFHDFPIWIATAEDIVLSKLHWAKDSQSPQQLRDVRALCAEVRGLDRAYLDTWADRLGVRAMLDTCWP